VTVSTPLIGGGVQATVVGPNGTIEGGNLNGNTYSVSPIQNQSSVDTLGRIPVALTSTCTGNPNLTCYDLSNSQGGTSRYTVTTESIPVHTNFGGTDFSGSITVIQSIGLPDGTSYSFNYDSGTTAGHFGDLISINLPAGGQINYSYITYGYNQLNSRWPNTRTSASGVWTYTPQSPSSNSRQVILTQPNGDNILYSFTGGSTTGWFLQQMQTYTGIVSPGNLLASTALAWDSLPKARMVSQTDSFPLPGGSTANRTVQFAYDSNNDLNVFKRSEWKYYTGSQPTTPDRVTTSVYTATDSNYTAYAAANILDRHTSVTITDGTGTQQLAQTKYAYDSTPLVSLTGAFQHDDQNFGSNFTTRGNLTQVQYWVTGTNFLNTTMTYDTTGQLRSVQDPALNTTSLSYADNFFTDTSGVVIPPSFSAPAPTNAYLTQVTLPASGSLSYGYYYGTGKRALARDQNGADSFSHYLDSLDRATLSYGPVLPSGKRPWSLTSYSSSETQIDDYLAIGDATAAVTCSSCTHSQTVLDNLRRPTTQELVNDPDGATFVNTSYDISGRVQNTSHPYRSTSDSTYGLETPTYDALGRVIKMTHQDGTYSQTFYGAAVAGSGLGGITSQLCSSATYGIGYPLLVIDEAGKKRESWTDGFGNLIEVDEPDSSGNLTSPTCYKYDLLGNLLQTIHGSQTRSYTYDTLSRVTSATVPEQAVATSGTTNVYYTTSGGAFCSGNPKEVCQRIDPRGITTTYTYDSLYRLTGKSYSDTTPAVTYSTEQTNCGTAGLSNGLGRVTGMFVADGSSSALWCYDAVGHLITDKKTIAGVTKTISYTFNSDGSLASIAYPSGRTLNYNVGNAGRPLSAIDSNGVQYVLAPSLAGQSGWTYAPTGAVSSLVYGKVVSGFGGITENRTYNNRLELTGIQATSTNGNALNVAPCNTPFSFGTGCSNSPTNNDANLTGITNNIVPGRSLTFINPDNTTYYDPLIRILSAKTQATSGPDCWGQTFTDDAYGNLLSVTTSQCSGFQLSVGVDANNHIITGGYGYDGAGNMTQDGSGFSYAYDAENRITSAAGVNYTYDGSGLRVKKSNGTLYWRGLSGNVLAETDLNGNITSEYVFFARRRVARRNGSGNTFFYNVDSLGTTRTITDANGNVCYDAEFTPYGTELIHTNTCPQDYKFTGYERDTETGLDYSLARYYNSRTGRFMSVDPMAGSILDPQSLNRYAYVRNNPINLTDPIGLWPQGLGPSNPHYPKVFKCQLDGAPADCGMVSNLLDKGAAVFCLNRSCSLAAGIEPLLHGSDGDTLGRVTVTGQVATWDVDCHYGDCPPGTNQHMIEIEIQLGTFYALLRSPQGGPNTGLEARLNALKRAGVIGSRIINGKNIVKFYAASAALGALGPLAGERAEFFEAVGNEALGEYLANLEEIGEFLDSFLGDVPAKSEAGMYGMGLKMLQKIACGSDEESWYCF
jgi:RHS repeat-associated protein